MIKARRALDKHGNRPGSLFPKARGNSASKNTQGQFQLGNILTDPTARIYSGYHNIFGETINVKVPNIGGVRFYQDGRMIGFLEP